MPETGLSASAAGLTALAPAKINLTLHVTGQRADGYHLLDSLVVFARDGDRLSLHEGAGLQLTGPQCGGLSAGPENLVLRAARVMGMAEAGFTLEKRLPVASGMGGGSSDAAAALRLLAGRHSLPLPDTAALMQLGADLPICMAAPAPARMRGLGEQVEPLSGVPSLWLLLVNPGQGLSTPAVFKALQHRHNPPMPDALPLWADALALCDWLRGMRNDLQTPAEAMMPAIPALLAQIEAQPGCRLARMTGSGATCFGIFADEHSLNAAAAALTEPGRFVLPTQSVPSLS